MSYFLIIAVILVPSAVFIVCTIILLRSLNEILDALNDNTKITEARDKNFKTFATQFIAQVQNLRREEREGDRFLITALKNMSDKNSARLSQLESINKLSETLDEFLKRMNAEINTSSELLNSISNARGDIDETVIKIKAALNQISDGIINCQGVCNSSLGEIQSDFRKTDAEFRNLIYELMSQLKDFGRQIRK